MFAQGPVPRTGVQTRQPGKVPETGEDWGNKDEQRAPGCILYGRVNL